MHPDEPGYVETVVAAARRARVGRTVYHSVASPYAPAMPHHLGKALAEDVVRRSGAAWTLLQPGPYVQNFPAGDPVRLAYRAAARFGFADLEDVAEVAARVLLEPGHEGATYELASVACTAGELLAALGCDVEEVTAQEWAAAQGAGLDARVGEWLRAMFAYYDRHGLPVGTLPMRTLLGRPPRTPGSG